MKKQGYIKEKSRRIKEKNVRKRKIEELEVYFLIR
jgi:hypothetical protein